MKNILLLSFLVSALFLKSFGQPLYIPINVKAKVINKVSKELNQGDVIKSMVFLSKVYQDGKEEKKVIVEKEDGTKAEVFYNDLFLSNFALSKDESPFWSYNALISGVYSNIIVNGLQYDIRHELEEESLEYLKILDESNMFYEDEVINDYLQSVLLKIYPNPLNDGRTGQINIRILKNNEPYAAILPNGTALISIGLLTLISSEEELMAVLAHETAHFVLDHSVQNINLAIKQQKRADFWAGIAAVAVAASSTYLAVNNDVYLNPYRNNNLIFNSAALAYSISSEISERIGLKFSRVQEFVADNRAVNLLRRLEVSPVALASVLSKLKDYYFLIGNYKAFSDNGTHPNITNRIARIGIPAQEFKSKEYDKKMSFLLSLDAYFEYKQSHYKTSESLINRIVDSGSATEMDYILKAQVNLAQYNSEDKYEESLAFLAKARTLGVEPDFKISKYESIVHLRRNDLVSAQKSLKDYKTELEKQINSINASLLASESWTRLYNQLRDELDWTNKMIFKTTN